MKQWHDTIRKRLSENRKECLDCLEYSWHDIKRTLKLLNKILKDIPIEAWPKVESDVKVASNNWCIKLSWDENKRTADLKFKNDDHTAWVIERYPQKHPVTFYDFDIGGS